MGTREVLLGDDLLRASMRRLVVLAAIASWAAWAVIALYVVAVRVSFVMLGNREGLDPDLLAQAMANATDWQTFEPWPLEQRVDMYEEGRRVFESRDMTAADHRPSAVKIGAEYDRLRRAR